MSRSGIFFKEKLVFTLKVLKIDKGFLKNLFGNSTRKIKIEMNRVSHNIYSLNFGSSKIMTYFPISCYKSDLTLLDLMCFCRYDPSTKAE